MRFYVVRNINLNQLVPECLLTNLAGLTRRSPSELHPVKEKVDQPRKTKLIKLWCYLPNPSHCLPPNASLWLSWSWSKMLAPDGLVHTPPWAWSTRLFVRSWQGDSSTRSWPPCLLGSLHLPQNCHCHLHFFTLKIKEPSNCTWNDMTYLIFGGNFHSHTPFSFWHQNQNLK